MPSYTVLYCKVHNLCSLSVWMPLSTQLACRRLPALASVCLIFAPQSCLLPYLATQCVRTVPAYIKLQQPSTEPTRHARNISPTPSGFTCKKRVGIGPSTVLAEADDLRTRNCELLETLFNSRCGASSQLRMPWILHGDHFLRAALHAGVGKHIRSNTMCELW